jgi:Phospholipid methyltransferase
MVAIALFAYSVAEFRAAGTPVPARKPTTAIVRTGPYRFSRNPIYLAFSLLQLGIGIWVNSLWLLATLVGAVALIHYVVIAREERYLEPWSSSNSVMGPQRCNWNRSQRSRRSYLPIEGEEPRWLKKPHAKVGAETERSQRTPNTSAKESSFECAAHRGLVIQILSTESSLTGSSMRAASGRGSSGPHSFTPGPHCAVNSERLLRKAKHTNHDRLNY